jgi:hypothetical protein
MRKQAICVLVSWLLLTGEVVERSLIEQQGIPSKDMVLDHRMIRMMVVRVAFFTGVCCDLLITCVRLLPI